MLERSSDMSLNDMQKEIIHKTTSDYANTLNSMLNIKKSQPSAIHAWLRSSNPPQVDGEETLATLALNPSSCPHGFLSIIWSFLWGPTTVSWRLTLALVFLFSMLLKGSDSILHVKVWPVSMWSFEVSLQHFLLHDQLTTKLFCCMHI